MVSYHKPEVKLWRASSEKPIYRYVKSSVMVLTFVYIFTSISDTRKKKYICIKKKRRKVCEASCYHTTSNDPFCPSKKKVLKEVSLTSRRGSKYTLWRFEKSPSDTTESRSCDTCGAHGGGGGGGGLVSPETADDQKFDRMDQRNYDRL